MIELINTKLYKVGDILTLFKYPSASAKIIEVSKNFITVEMSSTSSSLNGRVFKIKHADVQMRPNR